MKLNLAGMAIRTVPADSPDVPKIVNSETRAADAEIMAIDANIALPHPEVIDEPTPDRPFRNMSRLVDENFPFDDTQRAAIDGLSREKHACMTGAAGTGKTTTLKAVVDRIVDLLPHVDMAGYWKSSTKPADADDEYEAPEQLIPGVILCAYTGRATQMIKRNFPRDWHGNIMTIHRLLGFYPNWYDAIEPNGESRKKVEFIPTYTVENKLPWKVIIIDEAGMLGLDLWHQLLDACEDDCRIIMVGDINQLPPTHGKSIFGFAMAKWPSWELTHIHRQAGVNNSIVDNAWRVINGEWPKSDDTTKPDWKFVTMEIDSDSGKASKQVRKWLTVVKQNGVYDPIRDTVITPINAFDETSGFALGQDPLNRELAILFNSDHGRIIIDGGRERKYFAVGDKVMATKNDWEAGITNGMTGIITEIEPNPAYMGNHLRYGLVEDVQAYLAGEVGLDEEVDFTLDDISQMVNSDEAKEKESRDRGPSSHIVSVEFGHGDTSYVVPFGSLSEIASLMTAYVVTCHKMQGGESPMIVIICHQSHGKMLHREWLYTAITRASERCVILYTRMGMSNAINKQKIKGKTLAQKVDAFNKMQDTKGLLGASVKVRLPEPEVLEGERDLATTGFKGRQVTADQPCKKCGVATPNKVWCNDCMVKELESHTQPAQPTQPPVINVLVKKMVVNQLVQTPPAPAPKPIFNLKPQPKPPSQMTDDELLAELREPEPSRIEQRIKTYLHPTLGAIRMMVAIEEAQRVPLLEFRDDTTKVMVEMEREKVRREMFAKIDAQFNRPKPAPVKLNLFNLGKKES